MDTETFGILLDTVRRFVNERLIPNEDRVEAEDAVPEEIIAEMRELGLFGLSIPVEYGGLGLSMAEESEVAFAFGRTAFAFRSVFGTTVGIGSQGIVLDGTEAQKRGCPASHRASGSPRSRSPNRMPARTRLRSAWPRNVTATSIA